MPVGGDQLMQMSKHFGYFLCSALLCAAAFAETPEGVPKNAKESSPGVYRLVDKEGKAWVYRRTPFGYQKSAETEPDEAKDLERVKAEAGAEVNTPFGKTTLPRSAVMVKVTEEGDSVRFERPTPFGVSRWIRKKSELTDDERKLWSAHSAASEAATSRQSNNK
jgi:hypothetical protein